MAGEWAGTKPTRDWVCATYKTETDRDREITIGTCDMRETTKRVCPRARRMLCGV